MTDLNAQSSIVKDSPDPTMKCLIQTCQKLMETEAPFFYLGYPGKPFKTQTIWKCVGRRNQVITKESAIAVEKALEAQTDEIDSDSLLEPAVFSAIVFVDFNDCWLTPCGYWKGPTKVTKKFKDLKLSFQGKAPPKDFLSEDFSAILENAKALMDKGAVGASKSSGFLVDSKSGGNALCFQHVVFEVQSSF